MAVLFPITDGPLGTELTVRDLAAGFTLKGKEIIACVEATISRTIT